MSDFGKELQSMGVIYTERVESAKRIKTELGKHDDDAQSRILKAVESRLKQDAEEQTSAPASRKAAASE